MCQVSSVQDGYSLCSTTVKNLEIHTKSDGEWIGYNETVMGLVTNIWSVDFPGGLVVKNPPASAGARVQSLVQEISTCHGATDLCTATEPVL